MGGRFSNRSLLHRFSFAVSQNLRHIAQADHPMGATDVAYPLKSFATVTSSRERFSKGRVKQPAKAKTFYTLRAPIFCRTFLNFFFFLTKIKILFLTIINTFIFEYSRSLPVLSHPLGGLSVLIVGKWR